MRRLVLAAAGLAIGAAAAWYLTWTHEYDRQEHR